MGMVVVEFNVGVTYYSLDISPYETSLRRRTVIIHND